MSKFVLIKQGRGRGLEARSGGDTPGDLAVALERFANGAPEKVQVYEASSLRPVAQTTWTFEVDGRKGKRAKSANGRRKKAEKTEGEKPANGRKKATNGRKKSKNGRRKKKGDQPASAPQEEVVSAVGSLTPTVPPSMPRPPEPEVIEGGPQPEVTEVVPERKKPKNGRRKKVVEEITNSSDSTPETISAVEVATEEVEPEQPHHVDVPPSMPQSPTVE